MNVIVLVKQVPDTQNVTGEAMTPEGTVNRAALPAIFNPDDLYALEAALHIKDKNPGTKVNVVTMGPPAAAAVLKECLYRGADFTALVSDRGFAGADTLATSYALKCAINKIGEFDVVLCGRQAIDGDTAQVGPQTAEKLGINQITCVSKIESIDSTKKEIIAVRSIEGGWEKVKAKLPVLVTFTEEGEMPRPASAIKTMTYKRAAPVSGGAGSPSDPFAEGTQTANPMALWDIAAINADPLQCGLSGSPTKVKHINSVVLTAADIRYIDPGEAGVTELIHGLIADHTFG
ncbi:MAG: electron transfer flavoprotein subunit beta/FixA family protein [Treponema sp.]|jgi:electron transfer flavoprotein beta subunit|nr:electron transfer flavoprotein subunit beta/FixA family protein [Treponema sp.]